MNLQQLKYVLAIYKEGSITKASHALFCAQPNLSSALKSLENELHIKIFERTPGGVELTPRGRGVYFLCRQYNGSGGNAGEHWKQAGGGPCFPGNFRFPRFLLHPGAVAVDECQDPSGAAAFAAFL